MEKVYGMSEMTRHNLYNSAEVTGSAAAGYSSGQAIKAIEEVATSTLPHGYDYDFAGITKDEVRPRKPSVDHLYCMFNVRLSHPFSTI